MRESGRPVLHTAKGRSETRYGSMSRTVTLPPGANEDEVTADYTNGMLTVSVGMGREKTEEKHIEVKHGG
ncbi:Hsp20/alpha crystallin family protein [Streptomyces mexicanus]|uniref:Hsp20/alpha crystallin family protein n=1 Tax=Streptomyces mexicanus TaxID=178566 RepID=UPI0031E55852